MGRLQEIAASAAQQKRKLLIPYLVAGDPNLEASLALMHGLAAAGADVIELGIPFSDPASDGPVIQRAVERALKSKTTLADSLELVARFRADNSDTAVVLMGYLNPIEIMGYEAFSDKARQAGVDGVLVVDMPPAESAGLHQCLRAAGLETIYLVAPTTTDKRAQSIVEHCSGYLYYVSLKGVTGAALSDSDVIAERIQALRSMTDLPIVIGFGIKDADSARAMGAISDGVIIGSALVERIAGLSADAVPEAGQLEDICSLIALARQALDTLE
jgi:tryptophan synthase alpha chain